MRITALCSAAFRRKAFAKDSLVTIPKKGESMFNVCPQCGAHRADKTIDSSGPYAICPDCGYRQPFLRPPLLIVSGASGTGKSTLALALLGTLPQVVILDSDILWRPEFNTPEDNYRAFFETWLRMAKNIAQSGRPVLLFGAGMGVPTNIEPCVERRYFSTVAYLALVCDDAVLTERLRARPAWRQSSHSAFLEEQRRFNRWFLTVAGTPPITLVDTTHAAVPDTARRVTAWVHAILSQCEGPLGIARRHQQDEP